MSFLFLCLVLFTAVVGFFSQELQYVLKRIFSIPGATLFLPLLFTSLVVESYALWGYMGLSSLRGVLSGFEHYLSALLPFRTGALMLTRVLILMTIAMTPVCIMAFLTRKKYLSDAMFWTYRFSAAIWAVSVILLITGSDIPSPF